MLEGNLLQSKKNSLWGTSRHPFQSTRKKPAFLSEMWKTRSDPPPGINSPGPAPPSGATRAHQTAARAHRQPPYYAGNLARFARPEPAKMQPNFGPGRAPDRFPHASPTRILGWNSACPKPAKIQPKFGPGCASNRFLHKSQTRILRWEFVVLCLARNPPKFSRISGTSVLGTEPLRIANPHTARHQHWERLHTRQSA